MVDVKIFKSRKPSEISNLIAKKEKKMEKFLTKEILGQNKIFTRKNQERRNTYQEMLAKKIPRQREFILKKQIKGIKNGSLLWRKIRSEGHFRQRSLKEKKERMNFREKYTNTQLLKYWIPRIKYQKMCITNIYLNDFQDIRCIQKHICEFLHISSENYV